MKAYHALPILAALALSACGALKPTPITVDPVTQVATLPAAPKAAGTKLYETDLTNAANIAQKAGDKIMTACTAAAIAFNNDLANAPSGGGTPGVWTLVATQHAGINSTATGPIADARTVLGACGYVWSDLKLRGLTAPASAMAGVLQGIVAQLP